MITTDECGVLKGLIDLADPAVNENTAEHLPHRELLMFNAMIGAWRQAVPRRGPESEWFNKYSRDDCRHRFIGHLCIGINVSHGKYPNGSGDR